MSLDRNKEEARTVRRRSFLQGCFITAATVAAGGLNPILRSQASAPWSFRPDLPIIAAPSDPQLWPSFREQLKAWREAERIRTHYDDSLYRKPQFSWASSAYACCFLMMCDQGFYDHANGRYTVESLTKDGLRDFGGYDSIVLWHAYPRIGVDQRNQYDFYRDMPGGLPGLREVVHAFQKQGLHVYIDYNPWDHGTRRESESDADVLAAMVREMDVDGIFLDTLSQGGEDFRARLDSARPGVILEGELTPPLERIPDHLASWAQWFDDSEAPGVLRLKWFERRHLQHQTSRWSFSHVGELHTAWMNGSGMMIWENVFGTWMPWNERDKSLLRAMLPVQRRYARLFRGEGWTPLVPVNVPGVYASLWSDGNTRLWTIVNRTDKEVSGELISIQPIAGNRYFDLIDGREFTASEKNGLPSLVITIPAHGLGCLLAAPSTQLGEGFDSFLSRQAAMQTRASNASIRPRRLTILRPVRPSIQYKSAPEGMIPIVPPARLYLTIQMRSRECGFYDSMTEDEKGFRDSYEFNTREFKRLMPSSSYAIDATPVTNSQFAVFLRDSSYRPRHVENFLKHWSSGLVPSGKEDHPVIWIDLDDARAYASWAGKRLPTEEEWQFAAQGASGLEYPWGNGLRSGVCNLGETGDTTPVTAFPEGRSPAGCYDMCGNIWHWTESERNDGRTRFSIIRGGSYFTPKGSGWYVDGGPRAANFATKFLHMWPGLDRCATIGFRCAADLDSATPPA